MVAPLSTLIRTNGSTSAAAERAADLAVLSLGLGLGAVGGAALFASTLASNGAARVAAAVGLYAMALPVMFLCALLFSASLDAVRRRFLRRLDHAAIFALIAATATPFVVADPATSRLGVAAAIWAAAVAGIFIKLRYPIGRAYCSAAVFGLSGWALILALAPTMMSRRALFLIVLGGVLYTLGIGFHLWRRLRFHRAIWHAFVIAGAIAHYFAITTIV